MLKAVQGIDTAQLKGTNLYLMCHIKDQPHAQLGVYSYQFLVDGSWMTSPDASVAPDEEGHLCNRVSLASSLQPNVFPD